MSQVLDALLGSEQLSVGRFEIQLTLNLPEVTFVCRHMSADEMRTRFLPLSLHAYQWTVPKDLTFEGQFMAAASWL